MELKLKNDNLDDLMSHIDKIRQKGYLCMIKFDGERKTDYITILITSSTLNEPIRYDGDNLLLLLNEVINEFYNKYE